MFTTTKSAKNPSVHPHACGVHLLTVSTTTIIFGSSPRMWGTCTVFFLFIGRCRFIPTHVGYIARPLGDNLIITVHPHACGVHVSKLIKLIAYLRFIPTHVGYIDARAGICPATAVHPHACGVHSTAYELFQGLGGSSPRMWGTF